MAVTATLFDMQLIAGDSTFSGRVKASLVQYCEFSAPSKPFAAQILANIAVFVPNFAWAAACNQTLANDVVTTNGANFTLSTTPAQLAAAITTATPTTTGATDTDINNAVAAAFNAFANI